MYTPGWAFSNIKMHLFSHFAALPDPGCQPSHTHSRSVPAQPPYFFSISGCTSTGNVSRASTAAGISSPSSSAQRIVRHFLMPMPP